MGLRTATATIKQWRQKASRAQHISSCKQTLSKCRAACAQTPYPPTPPLIAKACAGGCVVMVATATNLSPRRQATCLKCLLIFCSGAAHVCCVLARAFSQREAHDPMRQGTPTPPTKRPKERRVKRPKPTPQPHRVQTRRALVARRGLANLS